MNASTRAALLAAGSAAAVSAAALIVRRLVSRPTHAQAAVTIGVPPHEIAELLRNGQLAAMACEIAPGALNVETVSIHAAPGNRGSELRVTAYRIHKAVLKRALQACKARIETGEVPTGKRSR